jgi:hypothetical protein
MASWRHPDAAGHLTDQTNNGHHGGSDNDKPPAYESQTDSPPPPPERFDSPETGSETNEVGFDQGWWSLLLQMTPDPGIGRWAAVLDGKCDDVARLMREGFFWSAEDILPEEGYMSNSTNPEWSAAGFNYARVWILADKSNGENPRWLAKLKVYASDFQLLPGFQVQNLSRKNVWRAHAWNPLEKMVYQYDRAHPGINFNCIYGARPLQGWWPWPREDSPPVTVFDPALGNGRTGDVRLPSLAFWQDEPPPPQPRQQTGGCIMI